MDRRRFLKKAGLAGVGLAAAPVLRVSPANASKTRSVAADAGSPALARAHCLWGAFARPAPGQSVTEARYAREKGRTALRQPPRLPGPGRRPPAAGWPGASG